MKTSDLQRVNVVGASGAGKTTLARDLGAKLGIAAVDLDDLHWLPDWKGRPKPEFDALLAPILGRDSWVIAGNYSRVQPRIWARAQAVIWLDYSLPVVMNRVVQRTLRRNLHRELCCNGNRESWRSVFSRESIVLYGWKTHAKRRREYPAIFSQPDYAHLQILRFQSPRQTRDWLSQI